MPVATAPETAVLADRITMADTRLAQAVDAQEAARAQAEVAPGHHPQVLETLGHMAMMTAKVVANEGVIEFVTQAADALTGAPGGVFIPRKGKLRQELDDLRKHPPLDLNPN
jgi:hypothetical protein